MKLQTVFYNSNFSTKETVFLSIVFVARLQLLANLVSSILESLFPRDQFISRAILY